MEVLTWIEETPVAAFVQTSSWAFPAIEVLHVIAVALVFGAIAVVDLRLIGVAGTGRRYAPVAADSLRVVWVAFILAVVTGALMFSSQAHTYFDNFYFRAKMLLLVFAGINMLVMEFHTSRDRHAWEVGGTPIPRAARLAGGLSLLFWIGIVVCGRWIGFTMFQIPTF